MDTREWSVEIGEDSVAESSGVECGVECGQKREVNCGGAYSGVECGQWSGE